MRGYIAPALMLNGALLSVPGIMSSSRIGLGPMVTQPSACKHPLTTSASMYESASPSGYKSSTLMRGFPCNALRNAAGLNFSNLGCIVLSSSSFALRSCSTRNESATLFDSVFAASSVNLAFSASDSRMTSCVPLNSIAKPTTRINQQIPEKISHECSFFLKLLLKNNLAIISAPSPATPINTILKPHSATDSQNLSDAESREVMRDIYRRQERLNFWTMIALAVLAIIGLIKIFIKKI